jgi:glycylpeptide N-tetradecanoyltransferase
MTLRFLHDRWAATDAYFLWVTTRRLWRRERSRVTHSGIDNSLIAHQMERAHIEEVIDTREADTVVVSASDSSDEEPQAQTQVAQDPQPAASASTSTSKKKKKKKSKAARAIASLRPQNSIPQSLVDQVVEKVKAEHGEGAPGTDEAHVRMALEQLKVGDVIKGKAGIGGKNRKEMGEHKVCQVSWVPA